MSIPDFINGTFEFAGSVAVWANVRALWQDRMIRGFRPGAQVFFTVWGLWNLYYYPHLDQLFSFLGGASLAAANVVYIAFIYSHRNA